MAESVSDQKVEDMLSSVRRLVSSELPRTPRPHLKEGASALVLTEAQRVEPSPPMKGQRGMTLEERIAELEAAVAGQSSDWEPDGSEDQEEHRPDRIVYRPSRPRDEDEARRPLRLSEIALIETGPAHRDDEPEGQSVDEVTVSFQHDETRSAEPESEPEPERETVSVPPSDLAGDPFADAIARDVAAVVAEMSRSAALTDTDFQAALAEAVRDPAETRGLERPDDVESVAEAPSDPERPVEDSEVPDAPEETPEARHETPETVAESEPLDAVQDDWQEIPETFAVPPSAVVGGPTREERAQVLDDDAPAGENLLTLTPEQLRLLVSSMIRQELQGELGERITRNVRKLVRQEVHRALSVRDLE